MEEISKKHNRGNFDCGEPALNGFLKNTARQSSDKRVTRTYVLVDDGRPDEILGFYTLVPSTITFPQGHPLAKKFLPDTPLYRMARLGVDQSQQNRKLGAYLLVEAIQKIVAASDSVGGIGCAVDAKNRSAAKFYERFGFEPIGGEQGDPLALWLPYSICVQVAMLASQSDAGG